MTEAIIVALITGGLSLLGVLITSNKTTRDVHAKLDTQQAVTDTKLDELNRLESANSTDLDALCNAFGALLGAVFSPPMVNSVVASPSLDRMVMVCLPAASVRRYTAFRYTSMLPASAM